MDSSEQNLSANLIIEISSRLQTAGYDERESRSVARLIAEDVFGFTLVEIYSGSARSLTVSQQEWLRQALQRLEQGEPIQYILGRTSFHGHEFQVAPGVLIPRPETEELVDCVIQDFQSISNPILVDAGTGSGCIAISLKQALPSAFVVGIDCSEEALRQARSNGKNLHAEVNWLQADLLRPSSLPVLQVDALVSNPPYVMERERSEMEARVTQFEPPLALFVPNDAPLLFYRALAEWGQKILKPAGLLYVEINRSLGSETCRLFQHWHYRNIELLQDINGNNRIVKCRK